MSLEKDSAAFKNAVEIKKKNFDGAEEFYNSNSFQLEKYPEAGDSNTIGKTKSAVYAFFVKKPKEHVDEILTAIHNIKTNQKDNYFPKVNTDCKEAFKENGCLYIGSVTSGTLEERIKQHWREKNNDVSNKTYALKLCDWFVDARINKEDITVYYCDMTGQKGDIIRIIEDCLATMYCPLLGKRGDSPKG